MDAIERRHAIETTRTDINSWIEIGLLKFSPGWLVAWHEYDLRFEPGEMQYPTVPAESLKKLCEASRKDAEKFELVKFIAAKRIMHGVAVPAPMSVLLGKYLLGDFAPIGPGSGRRRLWGRDIIIIQAMNELLKGNDLKATKRKKLSSEQKWINKRVESASELVERALIGTEIKGVSSSVVRTVWESKKKREQCLDFLHLMIANEFDDYPEKIRI